MGEIALLSLMSQTEHMPPPPLSGLWGSRGCQSVRLSLDAFTHLLLQGRTCARTHAAVCNVQIGPAAPEVAVDLVESD